MQPAWQAALASSQTALPQSWCCSLPSGAVRLLSCKQAEPTSSSPAPVAAASASQPEELQYFVCDDEDEDEDEDGMEADTRDPSPSMAIHGGEPGLVCHSTALCTASKHAWQHVGAQHVLAGAFRSMCACLVALLVRLAAVLSTPGSLSWYTRHSLTQQSSTCGHTWHHYCAHHTSTRVLEPVQ